MIKSKRWNMRLSVFIIICLFTAIGYSFMYENNVYVGKTNQEDAEELESQWEEAETTALTAYPELVTYTLGKMTGENNSNMPQGDTYEDNAYTRYLKEVLNIQNEDVLEATEDENYDLMIRRMVIEGNMPDVMVVDDYEYLTKLVESGLVEDLSECFENCATDTIKEIYASYGDGLLDMATFDGKLMALPSTQVYSGCSLLWLRDDWRKELGLDEPQTIEDVEEILLAFRNHQFDGVENVGIVSTASLVGMENSNFSMDPVFAAFGAYPQVWIKDEDGNYQYGSLTENTKNALAYLNKWYEEGILDENYMMRTSTQIGELIQNNQCGAFFGWWWAPNNPLMTAKEMNPDAEWVPYLITDDSGTVNSYIPYQSTKYVVVRKGYEHPEIVMKITSALFDEARYGDVKELEDYATSVDVTARPLVINCDYSQAVFYTTEHIMGHLSGKYMESKLNALEQAYLTQCINYMTGEETESQSWAAYASRIQAIQLITNGNVDYINEDYIQDKQQIQSQKLIDMETLAFMKIITGEEPLDYFYTFVAEWKAYGGEQLTDEQ